MQNSHFSTIIPYHNFCSTLTVCAVLPFLQEIPQQKNGSDCGVFTCKYADYIAKGRPLSFKQVRTHHLFFPIMDFILNFSNRTFNFPPVFFSSTVPHAALPEVNDLGNPQSEVDLENLGQKQTTVSAGSSRVQ